MNSLRHLALRTVALRGSTRPIPSAFYKSPRHFSSVPHELPTSTIQSTNYVNAEEKLPDEESLQPDASAHANEINAVESPSQIIDLTQVDPNITADVAGTAVDVATSSFSLSDFLLQPAMSLLNVTHDATNLPWYLAIAASTIAIRTMLMPATLFTMRNSAKMQAIQPDILEKREEVMAAVKSGNRTLASIKQSEIQQFMKGAGIAPAKVLVGPLLQFPVFISLFVSVRRLSQSDVTFVDGGAAWFTNLSVMDPTYVLPVICGISLLGMTELGGDTGSTKLSPLMRTGMRAVALLSVPMTYWFPAAIFCYWIPNNMFSIALGVVLRTTRIRKKLGLEVDPARIPGTRAAKALEANMASLGRKAGMTKKVSDIEALSSYGKVQSSSGDRKFAKPVLFKQRPSKKKIEVATN